MKLKEVAKRLKVSERTLRNWKSMAKDGHFPKEGRPTYSPTQRLKSAKLVKEAWLDLGRPGIRPVKHHLGGKVPDRLIQRYVRLLKKKQRKIFFDYKKSAPRCSVVAKDVIWTQDATHIGRDKNGKSIESQVLKDRSSLKVLNLTSSYSASQEDIILFLEKTKLSRGGLPLVWMTDNGSCYIGSKVMHYLKQQKVVHLRSLPRTPQHNGASEVCIRELKRITNLGKKNRFRSPEDCLEILSKGQRILNTKRLYGSKNYKTSQELEDEMVCGYNMLDRETFYDEYLKKRRMLDEEVCGARQKRLHERELVFGLLEKYGLIKITRGRELSNVQKTEVFL